MPAAKQLYSFVAAVALADLPIRVLADESTSNRQGDCYG
jgi:hypothetical protein